MPSYILRPDREKAEYVQFSTVIDMPSHPHLRPDGTDEPDRYDRADATGTSAYGALFGGYEQDEFDVGWPFIEAPEGFCWIVRRQNLVALARLEPTDPNTHLLELRKDLP